ncbi:MAG: hypothetical protein ABR970_15055 [Roseiarcus sp.]|jgi:hypothetical protein
MRVKAWVSHSFVELGDHGEGAAPIREVTVVGYDGGRYADVIVCGQPARCAIDRITVRPEPKGPAAKAPPKSATAAMARQMTDSQTTYSRIRAMQDDPRTSIHARVKAAKPASPAA